MEGFRTLLMRHRALASLLVAAALCLKALMPAGYMLDSSAKVLTVTICDAATGHGDSRSIIIPMKQGKAHGEGEKSRSDCAYGSLGMASLAGTDPVVLALAIAFILLLGFAAVHVPAARQILHLRPPLRGPPSPA